jgi:arginase
MTAVRQPHLVLAPCNLGLRPLSPGHEPGTWRAPEALLAAGLGQAVHPAAQSALPRPAYDFEPQPGTRWRNGHGIRAFNEALADEVAAVLANGRLPLVVGGDCSILLGCLAAARRSGEVALIHIDGHSDLRNPANHDFDADLGAAAGADLALAIGLGESLLTDWGQQGPLVRDTYVIQIGEREARDPGWSWGDIARTAITRLEIFDVLDRGITHALTQARAVTRTLPYWVHVDIDVVDQVFLPAVDSPGSPGLDFEQLAGLLRPLVAGPQCQGCDLTIFDPELDPAGTYARRIVAMLGQVF